jgi:hypothetical protein
LVLEKAPEDVSVKLTCILLQALLMRPLGIGSRGRFLFVTTAETKTGVLLIEQFRTLINQKMMATWFDRRVAIFCVVT